MRISVSIGLLSLNSPRTAHAHELPLRNERSSLRQRDNKTLISEHSDRAPRGHSADLVYLLQVSLARDRRTGPQRARLDLLAQDRGQLLIQRRRVAMIYGHTAMLAHVSIETDAGHVSDERYE
jgi:hypothetical protein